ncbi:diguanylate cyclase [Paludibacterium sp. THUN1379]|uniref:GGDEF domain-containing protein n=1 Tax=Paludibacterium sp. THUN1379 TaxID=3112107 RepID=UPI0030907F6D|nr:diguanylate cyclase [Paludibacterium sp. THUN1379]
MLPAPIPDNESLRLAALDSFDLLDTPAEERFDRLTRVAAHALSMPMALITFVASDRQWFKSRVGLTQAQTPRDWSFCAHAILLDEPLVVPDTRLDERFYDNPMVRDAPAIRFYAGVPLRLAYGVKIGTLCVMDTRPRTLSEGELAILLDLARVVEETVQQDRMTLARPSEFGLLASAQRASLLDAVTGCWNRAGFEALLQAEVEHARQHDLPFAMLLLSVEPTGIQDELVMAEVASRLRRVVQGVGTVARFAPECFVLLVSPCDRPMLGRVQRRVRTAVQDRHLTIAGREHLNVSTGAAVVSRPGFDVALALVDADRRLRQARQRAASSRASEDPAREG